MRLLAVLVACLAGALGSPAESQRFPDVRYATTPGVEANLQSLECYERYQKPVTQFSC